MKTLDRNAVREFIKKCLAWGPSWIVPIPSEGVAMLGLATDIVLGSGAKILYADKLTRRPVKAVEGQKALVLDFSVYQGKMMNVAVNRLLAMGAEVATAAFVVHEACPPESRPDMHWLSSSGFEYGSLKDMLIDQTLNEQHLYDSDHVDIRLEVSPFDHDTIVEAISRIGPSFWTSDHHDQIERLTVEFDAEAVYQVLRLPQDAECDTVCKTRILVSPDMGELSVAGLFFPSLPVDVPVRRHRCPVPVRELSICNILQDLGTRTTSRDCFDSCTFYAGLWLVRAFMNRLRYLLPSVSVVPIQDQAARLAFDALFPLVSDRLWPAMWAFLGQKEGQEEQRFWQRGLVLGQDDCAAPRSSESYANAVVAAEVFRAWRSELSSECARTECDFENLGTSYLRLCNATRTVMTPRAVSRAFDILLDEGVVRPIVAPRESVTGEGGRSLWTRCYRPAGEQVGRVLKHLSGIRHPA